MTQLLVNEGLAFVANNNLGRRATGQQLFDSGCTRDLNRVRPHRENARMTPCVTKEGSEVWYAVVQAGPWGVSTPPLFHYGSAPPSPGPTA